MAGRKRKYDEKVRPQISFERAAWEWLEAEARVMAVERQETYTASDLLREIVSNAQGEGFCRDDVAAERAKVAS